jgi:hypothetical protein
VENFSPFCTFLFWREGEGGNIEFDQKKIFLCTSSDGPTLSSFDSHFATILQLSIFSFLARFYLIPKVNSIKIFNAIFAIFGSFFANFRQLLTHFSGRLVG